MPAGDLIVRNNIKKVVKELDKENKVPNVAEEVGAELEKVTRKIIEKATALQLKNQPEMFMQIRNFMQGKNF